MVRELAYSQVDPLPPKAGGGMDGGEFNGRCALGVRVLAPSPGTCSFGVRVLASNPVFCAIPFGLALRVRVLAPNLGLALVCNGVVPLRVRVIAPNPRTK